MRCQVIDDDRCGSVPRLAASVGAGGSAARTILGSTADSPHQAARKISVPKLAQRPIIALHQEQSTLADLSMNDIESPGGYSTVVSFDTPASTPADC
jgi:hypothetical protein